MTQKKQRQQLRFDVRLNKLQQDMFDAFKDYRVETCVVNCSRQMGKSIGSEILMISALFSNRYKFNAWLSPTFRQAKKVYKEILNVIPDKYIKTANSTDLIIQLINNQMLQFFSGESIESMRGFTIRGLLIIDECAFFKNTDWFSEIVLPTLKNAKFKKVFLISTPNGKSGTFYDYYLLAKNKTEKMKLIEYNIYDDPFITEEEIEIIKKRTPDLIFQQEYLAKFLDSAITVFNGFEYCFKEYTYNKNVREWCGIDLSTVGEDNTVLTFFNELKQTEQYIIRGRTLNDKYKQLANLINSRPNLLKGYLEINAIGEPIYEELKKYLNKKEIILPFLTTNQSKKDIVDNLAVLIANKEISFQQDNTQLFQEMGLFTYYITQSRNVIYKGKDNAHDDTVISLCIACQCAKDYPLKSNISFATMNNIKLIS